MRFFALFAALLLEAVTSAASAEPVFPRGGSVGLEPPPGMPVTTDFLGFQKGLSSILITELPPRAFAELDGNRERFAVTVENARTADFAATGGARGFIVRGRQKQGGRTYRKWAVMLGGEKATVLVTAQILVGEKAISDAAVEAALRTIVLREPPSTQDQVAALPFVVGDLAGFRIVRTLMGAGLILTEGPKDEDPGIEQPSIVVSTSLNHPPAQAGRLDFAKSFLGSLRPIRDARIESAELFTAQGAQWALVRAKAARGKADVPVDVALFMRFGEGDFITVICTAPSSGPGYADRFRQLALSVSPKG